MHYIYVSSPSKTRKSVETTAMATARDRTERSEKLEREQGKSVFENKREKCGGG